MPSRQQDISPHHAAAPARNVAGPERWASFVAGGLLTYFGLRRGWIGKLLLGGLGGALVYRGATGRDPMYDRLGLNTASSSTTSLEVDEAITVQATPQEVYDFWRDVERFPEFMHHLEKVEALGDGRSRWTARAPKEVATVSWETEITDDEPGRKLAWRSLPGADVHNTGTVRFAEAPKQGATEVHIQIAYHPPEGAPGSGLAARLFNPAFEQLIKEDARRFKHLMEAGEVPTIEGQPKGGG